VPKMKTHRGAAKRFSKTGSGKITRQRANKQHILTKKTTKRKRMLRKDTLIDEADKASVRKLLPYL
jgi:large subunit ribosomal protein L35